VTKGLVGKVLFTCKRGEGLFKVHSEGGERKGGEKKVGGKVSLGENQQQHRGGRIDQVINIQEKKKRPRLK